MKHKRRRRKAMYGDWKRPYCGGERKRVNRKVAPFVKLIGPTESSRRVEKENGFIFVDR